MQFNYHVSAQPFAPFSLSPAQQRLVISGLLIVMVLLGEWLGVVPLVRSGVQKISQPLSIVTNASLRTVIAPWEVLTARYKTTQRVVELEHELNTALATLTELERVKAENDQLRQALGAQTRPVGALIASSIVSYGVPTLSVGEAEGVKPGVVVLANGTLVGRVSDVSVHQSIVTLLSHSQSVPVVVRTESGSEGLLVGDGKRVLLTEVPRDAPLRVGEVVTTAGQAQVPAQLLVGKIQEVITAESASVHTAVVEQLADFYSVSVAEVLP